MKGRNLLVIILGLVLSIVAIYVIAGSLETTGITAVAPAPGANLSGTKVFSVNITNANGSLPVTTATFNITNVTITFISLTNLSVMANVTISNSSCVAGSASLSGCVNRTLFNVSVDTSTIADGIYNLTFTIYNVTAGDGWTGPSHMVLNWSYFKGAADIISGNITIDNTQPKNVTIFAPAAGAARTSTSAKDAGEFLTLNASVFDGYPSRDPFNGVINGTGIQRVFFNFTNGTMNFAINATNHNSSGSTNASYTQGSGFWGARINASLLTEENPSVVTVWAVDFAGNINRTATINLNINRLENQNLQNTGVNVTAPKVGTNVSGSFLFSVNITKGNGAVPSAISGITNVTITLYSLSNGSVMYNTTINNATCGLPNCANSTRFNVSIDTTTIPDNIYNITFTLYNITEDATLDTSKVFLNWTFYRDGDFSGNFTIDNTKPKNVTIFNPGTSALASATEFRGDKDAGEFLTLNVSVFDGYPSRAPFNATINGTGIKRVVFNFTNGTMNFAINATNQNLSGSTNTSYLSSGFWGARINVSRLTDERISVITVWAEDFAGNVNKTITLNLNIDRLLPTVTLTKNTEESDQTQIKIDVSTSADANTCTSSHGTVSGSGASQTIKATGLTAETEYTFEVLCRDELGNTGSASLKTTTDALSGGSAGDGGAGGGAGGARAAAKAKATTPTVVTPEPGRVVADLVVRQATPITIGSVSHTVTVQSVTAQRVTIQIASEPVTVSLNLGETKEVDTDRDGKNDLSVKYVSLSAGKPKLEFVSLAVSVPSSVREAPSAGERTVPEEAAGAAKEAGRSTVLWVVAAVVIIAGVGAYIALRKRE